MEREIETIAKISALLAGACALGLAVAAARSEAPVTSPPERAFYADLGPDTIDVSDYDARQRRDYALARQRCSQCHTFARAVNSPLAERAAWQAYMARMRKRSRFFPTEPITKDEERRIVDFLEYDSRRRKIDRRRDFELLTERLKSRFQEGPGKSKN